jgi:superfamily I DNA/RNA helicase
MWTPDDDLFDLMKGVENLIGEETSLGRFLGQLTPLGHDIANARADGVRIMSLASSKGLTVRATIIAGCEEGIIPRQGKNPSEEVRLLFVGMTRSREVLYCTWARRRTGPTARAGITNPGRPRNVSTLFSGGPVQSRNGDSLL